MEKVAVNGERVKEERKAQGMSQQTLSENAKISISYIRKIENGEMTEIRPAFLSGIARALKVRREEIG